MKGYEAEEGGRVKLFVINGLKDGGLVFSFSVTAYSSRQAIEIASGDELIKDMEFDRLVMKELKE